MIKLSDKQELAYGLLHYSKSPITRVLYGGAAGGGKTYLGCIFQITRRMMYPDTRGFIARKVHSDLMKSTYKTFVKTYNEIAAPRIGELKYNGQTNTVTFPNGSEILFLHLSGSPSDPEYQSLGSFEFTDGFIDEVGEVSQNAVDVLYSRIRHNLINNKPALLMASNPTYGWLKTMWISKEGQEVVLPDKWFYVRAIVQDNPDKTFVSNYVNSLNELPDYHRNRLLIGDWDYQTNDSNYYPEFTERCLYDSLDVIPNIPILLSFDFNYDPTTCVMMQNDKLGRSGLLALKEFSVKGGTRPLCMVIKKYLEDNNINNIIKITGDSSGHNRSTVSGVQTDFNIIQEVFKIPKSFINYKNNTNMRHDLARDLINEMLHHDLIKISRSGCPELIQDLRKAKADITGKRLLKDRDRYKMDLHDAFKYGCCFEFPDAKSIRNY
ncbi:MAG: hypothetical protein IT276_14800 [Ignavibacteriaceae bacterium]|nr:hypothetical protein [Ignavibacteriaceae bacterium]